LFTQALQLIYAGRRPALRCRSTVGALDQLLFAGRITEAEWRTLTGAYRFLRGVEHLLQLDSGRQTQRLPSDPSELEQFAHRAGSADADDFLAVLHGHTDGVARLFATLGDAASGPPPGVSALLGGELETERELRVLAELGFRDPAQAHHQLERSRRRAASPFAPAATGVAARVGPALFAEVCTSPDPDQALRYVADLSSRYGTWSSLWRMMDENPVMRRLVASLFGTSEYLSRHFIDHPELFDMLLSTGRSHPRHRRVELQALAATRLAEVADGDEEAWWNTLAEWKNAQVLRIGLADIAGELDSDEVCHQLSNLAEVCLARAYDRVRAALEERHGVPRDADGNEVGMAVLGLGKLGGRELGYASDLDVLFVYSADGDSDGPRPLANVTYLTRLAQRLMGGLHALHPGGRLYEVDTRLRPSGSAGLLVSTLAAWERYHREGARLWERQALIKLRPVAGDRALGAEVERSALACVYGPPADPAQADPAAVAAAINAMKERIETELSTLGKRDVKVGRGGIIDIEFACQYLQLVHGPSHPSMRSPSTLAALTAAAAAVPEVAETCSLLADAYRFFRTLEHRMRIVHDRSVHRLPDEGPELEKLARRVGLGDGAGLAEIYDRWTRDVRRAYSDLLVPAAR
jgi:glutamate-ammonia-ligase adenylyltransferase